MENINKNELTNEQLDQVVDTLEENLSEDDKLIRDIINNEINPSEELESEIINMSVDPDTGALTPIITGSSDDEVEPSEKEFDFYVEDEGDRPLSAEDLQSSTSGYNLSDDESKQLLEVIIKYQTGTKFNIYEELPEPIKKYVDEFFNVAIKEGREGITKNAIARFFLEEFIKETKQNREFIDFQTALEKELQIPSISDMYSEHVKETMEVKLLEAADRLQEEHPDKAESLRKISAMFTESYTFGLMKSTLINNKKARNRIRESVKEYNKYCNDFNYRIADISIKINDIFMVAKSLNRVLPEEISLDDIKKFVVLFCKTCEGLDTNNIIHCAYMYYTIKNIVSLDFTEEAKTDFSKTLIDNIIATIKFINETQEQVESSMPEKLLKKKIKKCKNKK